MLSLWADTLAIDFGEGEREAQWVRSVYSIIGLGDDVPWRHYLGFLDGIPVATVTLFLTPGVAGIYFVMALPAFRRRGFGAAITRAAMDDGLALGAHLAVLGASEDGYHLYRQMGFTEQCEIAIFEWSPPTQSHI